jgi:hypothetical protein
MVAMAKAGQGNHYYGATAQDLFEPFAEEFDLIANLYAGKLRLTLGTPEGIKASLLNDYVVEDQRGFPVIRLPDLAWGAEAWAMLELDLPAPTNGDSRPRCCNWKSTPPAWKANSSSFRMPPNSSCRPCPPKPGKPCCPMPLVLQRLNELEAGKLLERPAPPRKRKLDRIDRLLDRSETTLRRQPLGAGSAGQHGRTGQAERPGPLRQGSALFLAAHASRKLRRHSTKPTHPRSCAARQPRERHSLAKATTRTTRSDDEPGHLAVTSNEPRNRNDAAAPRSSLAMCAMTATDLC